MIAFGPHLVGDLEGCDVDLMRDGEFVYRFMLDLCWTIGLKPMGSPHIDFYTGPHAEWDGASATLHIETSHITAHFFAFGYVFVDIFSCRPFDHARAMSFVQHALGATDAVWRTVRRGGSFPDELKDPAQIAEGETW